MPSIFIITVTSLAVAIAGMCFAAYIQAYSNFPSSHPVPRRAWSTHQEFVFELAEAGEPVVLTGSDVEQWPASRQWSSAAKIARIITAFQKRLHGVYHQPQGTRFGPFYDPQRPFHALENVQPRNPYKTNASLSPADFQQAFVRAPSANSGNQQDILPMKARKEPMEASSLPGGCWAYSGAVTDALGPDAEDALEPLDAFLGLNPSQSSVNLWLGQPGATTPCHYDSYHNFYAQLAGRKRFVLFPPANAALLRTYPFLHPSFAQCHARIPALDPRREMNWELNSLLDTLASWMHRIRFVVSRYRKNKIYYDATSVKKEKLQPIAASPAWVVDLEPGDLLYIPPFWLHEATALNANGDDAPRECGLENGPASVSVNVWTSSADSIVAETLFALPLPSESTNDKAANASSKAANAAALVWVVLCRHFASEEGSNGHQGAAALLKRLAIGRYVPLIDTGELPRREVGDDMCVHSSDLRGDRNERETTSSIEAYSQRATLLMAKLSQVGRGRQSPWLQNWVEMIMLKTLPLGMVPSVIMGISECF